jgi:cysteine synthase
MMGSFGLSAISYQLSAIGQSNNQPEGTTEGTEARMFRALRIVVAGGGTGGHLFPGIAIANEFMARNSATRVIFVNTGNQLEKTVLSKAGFELRSIEVAGIKGRGIWNQFKSVLRRPWKLLSRTGGYGSLADESSHRHS